MKITFLLPNSFDEINVANPIHIPFVGNLVHIGKIVYTVSHIHFHYGPIPGPLNYIGEEVITIELSNPIELD